MYPEINALITGLHQRSLSTFLVTNAQFPEAMRNLVPVTQLYVSVDAATETSLKAIDRPLFGDFWKRFRDCLSLLRQKRQRTVYRLTLVKDWNMEEIQNYAELIALGEPDFVEIKGVTYCGNSTASNLTMKNVPYHQDVCEFGNALCGETKGELFIVLKLLRLFLGVYGLACEHAHSCCILLARLDRFCVNGRWCTWIDYDKFQRLARSEMDFASEDYRAETPNWALFGSDAAGFDPNETPFKKQRNRTNQSAS